MPCCSGHGSGHKLSPPLLSSRPTPAGESAGDALQNLSVLKTLSEHVDAATAVACYSVCRAWREAFGLSCLNSTMCTSDPVDSTRARFAANLHGAVTLEVTQPAPKAQRGFERHIAALARNRHFLQLKVHLPVREAQEPQLDLGALSSLQPLTQLTSLVISRNPAFTGAPHNLTADDIQALSFLRNLTFLELCTAVPPPLGLDKLASLATASLTQLRTLAFGHTSALWHIPEVSQLCQLLDVCPLLTDLRLRCCAPPKDVKQLPDLMALPLPQRLTNFALTFARRLARGEGTAAGGPVGPPVAAGAGVDEDEDVQYGEYEDMDEPWDSIDHLAPKPGLHVLIVEKGTRVTRMDVNITVSVAASELPTVPVPGASRRRQRAGRGLSRGATAASGSSAGPAGQRSRAQPQPRDSDSESEGGDAGGAADEEDVPPYDVTPMVLAEYNRLLQHELGLKGTLAEPEDLHLGVRLDILEDEDDALAGILNNIQHLPVEPMQMLQMAAQLQAAQQQHMQQQQPNQGQLGAPGAGLGGLLPVLAAAANGGGAIGGLAGGNLAAHLPPGFAVLLNHMAQLHLGGGGGGAGGGGNGQLNGGGGGNPGPGGAAAAAGQPNANLNHHNHHQHGPGNNQQQGNREAEPLAARAVQLQLGPLSPHMCYLNLALVPMVTQAAILPAMMGPNGEILQPQQPPADTRVAPVLLDLRGGGYTQLKSLAITGFVDHDCKPATWMSRGWLSRIPTGMPSLEYLALYDTLPATTNDSKAIEGLRALSRMEHLELRPLYLRFTGEVPCPMAVPPPVLPPKLLQLTLKKVTVPASPPPPPGASPDSPAALALLPELPTLTHLWLFDCSAPDLTVFRRATRLEDLRLGGTTTTTRLSDLLPSFPCLRGLILDCSYAVAPGWWSSKQMSALLGLRCLRSLQIDAASLESPPPPSPAPAGGPSGSAGRAGGSSRVTIPGEAGASTSTGQSKAKGASSSSSAAAAARVPDSDDDSDAYLSTEEDSPLQLIGGSDSASAGKAAAAGATQQPGSEAEPGDGSGDAAPAAPVPAGEAGDGAQGSKEGGPSVAEGGELAAVLGVLAGLTQLTDLTLSFDTPTLFYDPDEEEEEDDADGHHQSSADGDQEDAGSDDDSSITFGPVAGTAAGGGSGAKARAGAGRGGGGGGGGSVSGPGRDHAERVYDALLAGQAFVALAALQGLWRLRIGLPHGAVWEDVTERLLPGLRIAMPRTAVEMDVL